MRIRIPSLARAYPWSTPMPRKKFSCNWQGAAERLEAIIECLADRQVRATVDCAAAARAVEYCRKRAAGAPEDLDAEAEINDIVYRHGQSLDWVFRGDPGVMICNLAEGTTSRRPPRLHIA